MEALWKVDLDYGTSGATTESRGPSPYDSPSVGSFLLPGDEPPWRNYTFSSPVASSRSRLYLPPNSSDLSAGSSSYTVKNNSVFSYTLSIVYSIYTATQSLWGNVDHFLIIYAHCVSIYIISILLYDNILFSHMYCHIWFVFIQFSRVVLNVPKILMEIPGRSIVCWWTSELQVCYMLCIIKQNILYSECCHIIKCIQVLFGFIRLLQCVQYYIIVLPYRVGAQLINVFSNEHNINEYQANVLLTKRVKKKIGNLNIDTSCLLYNTI